MTGVTVHSLQQLEKMTGLSVLLLSIKGMRRTCSSLKI